MKYNVIWTPDAEELLANLWLGSIDRNFLTWAIDHLEVLLARNPLGAGDSRSSSIDRICLENNVGVAYEVIEDDKKVFVHSVWVRKVT